MLKVLDKRRNCIWVEKGAFSEYIRTGGRGWVMIWEDSEDDCYLNTMPRLVIWLNKPLSRYYRDDEYLEGLNDMNTIIGMNIHSFIIESPGSGPTGLQLRPILHRCSNSLRTTTSFSSLSKARVHYILARPY